LEITGQAPSTISFPDLLITWTLNPYPYFTPHTMTDPSFPSNTSALVIGGGPAGLVSLKYLKNHTTWIDSEEPLLVEQESEIGGTFRWRAYENAELVSSKQLTCFSDFRYAL
jgi:cation diffusion facilitator CzcD-associated flavoprotein CzcO